MEDVMAYSDTNPRPTATRLAMATAFPALMIVGLIFAGPTITGDGPTSIKLTNFDKAKPKPVPIDDAKPQPNNPTRDPVNRKPAPTPSADDTQIASRNGLTIPTGGDITIPSGGGMIIDPIPTPLPAPDPVIIAAKLNPRHAGALQPQYPPGRIREGIEGVVVVRVKIGVDGRVTDVQPVGSADPEFLAATRKQALTKWRFLPATRDGVAFESWREMTVRFQLPD
jgi:periplasmic protein TonB